LSFLAISPEALSSSDTTDRVRSANFSRRSLERSSMRAARPAVSSSSELPMPVDDCSARSSKVLPTRSKVSMNSPAKASSSSLM
jgi:hypothetical protein